MMSYRRYAIYDLPSHQYLSELGARWLGWDAVNGCQVQQLDLDNIQRVTNTPSKYGFHATLKPPFRLANDCSVESLHEAVSRLAAATRPVTCAGLQISVISRFLALTPIGDTSAIDQLATHCVRSLDSFRAPLDESELARRRAADLTDRQETLLQQWGYPYVAEEFNYHITLTGKLERDELQTWLMLATDYFDLPAPYTVESLALVGQRKGGEFELINRYALGGGQ